MNSILSYGEEVKLTIHVDSAGSLPSLIDSSLMYQVTDLTLSGNLNGTDLRFIRGMAGFNWFGDSTPGILSKLDMKDVTIHASDMPYRIDVFDDWTSHSYTEDNKIGDAMFSDFSNITSIILPTSVNAIGNNSFTNCSGLKYIELPDAIKSIGINAFKNCSALDSIILPDSLRLLSYAAFQGCTGLKTVTIPSGITKISGESFADCTGLTSLQLPEGVTTIGGLAFMGNTGLTTVQLPNSLLSIEGSAFFKCSGLTSIRIPGSVVFIGKSVFRDCTQMDSIIVDESNAYYCSVDGILFNKTKTELVSFPNQHASTYTIPNGVVSIYGGAFAGCTELKSVIVSASVKTLGEESFRGCSILDSVFLSDSLNSIESYAFSHCASLLSITIPEQVTVIGNYAFWWCTGLIALHIKQATPLNLNSYTFYQVNKDTCKLYVPAGSASLYQSASVWSDFKYILEESPLAPEPILYDDITVLGRDGLIMVSTTKTARLQVYDLCGRSVYKNTLEGSSEIVVDKGVYIVSINGRPIKIMVM